MDDAHTSLQGQHRQAWDAIPWLVNGTATPAERSLAEAHLAVCSDCSDELRRQRQWRSQILAGAQEAHDPEPALRRLWSRIDRTESESAPDEPASPADSSRLPGSKPRVWTAWLVAAVVVQSVGLAALLGVVWERPRASEYVTLSRPTASPDAATIRLVPSPELRLAELQRLLSSHGLHIVGSSDDARILSLASLVAKPVDTTAVLSRLRATPGVLLAEPIVSTQQGGR